MASTGAQSFGMNRISDSTIKKLCTHNKLLVFTKNLITASSHHTGHEILEIRVRALKGIEVKIFSSSSPRCEDRIGYNVTLLMKCLIRWFGLDGGDVEAERVLGLILHILKVHQFRSTQCVIYPLHFRPNIGKRL